MSPDKISACINARLCRFLESSGVLGEEQAGFRSGYSTTDHIFVLHSLIDIYLSKRKRVYCCFIDYKTAFDLIHRSSLWSKLISCGINGKVVNVIYNMYEQAKSCVRNNNQLSDFFTCNAGVRQGENLSPLLFSIYLNDFESYVSRHYQGLSVISNETANNVSIDDAEVYLRLFVLLYADDTIVMAESPEELQRAINAVANYCDKWNLTINRNKTKIVIFSRGKVRRCPVIVFKNEPLEVVNNYVYLGVSFNYNGRFAKAISKQVSQARRALFSLLSKAVKLRLPVDIVVHLFDQLVKPILLYGCEVWGFENCTQIEVFHRQFCKRLLKLNKATSNCMVYGELGQVEIAVAIQQRMVVFWSRIILGKQSKISYIIYRLLRGMMENGTYQSKWLSSVKATLNECGNQNLWSDENVASCEWVKLSLGLKLSDIFKQKWHDEVSDNRLCINYRIFKHEHKMEKYLTLLDRGHRINLTKFRCGNHKLPVNSGRFQGRPRCERICNLCTSNVTGDEFHYVFDCSFFDVERRSLIKPYYLRRPNTVKMEQLFNMTSAKWLTSLSNFVKIIMNTF